MDKKNVEDLYPLSPMQQGMLFHSLYDPGSGAYIEQMVCTLRGDLDIPAFERAWQRVIDRHPALRTAFVGEGLREPAQMVLWRAQSSLARQDWRGLARAEQEQRLEAFIRADRAAGFELAKAPLVRLALLQTAEDVAIFVWTYHHILLDGWSIPLLFKEVFVFYETFHRDEDVQLELPRPYRDYIVWLKQHTLADAEPFWRRTLQGFSAPTPLMLHQAPAEAAGQEERHEARKIPLSLALTDALASLAQKQHMTVSTLVQAAWGLLLSRYSGENDVVFGVAVSGRPADLAGVESMVGMFMNTLPMRVYVPWDAELLSWLEQVRALQIEMQQYEYSPLVEVQGWSEVPRGTPLFDNMLVFQGHLVDNSLLEQRGSIEIRDVHFVEAVNYPLVVDVVLGSAPSLNVLYSSHRFDDDAITRMMKHFTNLLEGMAANPQRRLVDLPFLTEAEQRQLLAAWNDTLVAHPQDRCYHQLFEAQVEQTPDSTAAIYGDDHITYRPLNLRANRLASILVEQRIGPDMVVALLAERDLDFLTSMLAVFKAGGAFVPLDPRHPAHRLRQVLHQSHSALVLCADDFGPALSGAVEHFPTAERPLVLRLSQTLRSEGSMDNRPPRCTPRNLAYVIYTSGSTGIPKGAMIEQRGMVNHMYAKIHTLQLTAGDVIAQTAPQSFDISIWQFLTPLLVGGCVRIFPDEIAFDPTRLLDEADNRQVTILQTVPSMMRAMLDSAMQADQDACTRCSLRWLIPNGEVLPPDMARQWFSRYPHTALINAYGPTECSDDVLQYPFAEPPAPEVVRIPIGRPLDNMRLYVLDAQLRLVPVGVAGELHIGGVGVGRGYLREPAKTAQTFIPNPFTDFGLPILDFGLGAIDDPIQNPKSKIQNGTRLYKTGDLVYWRSDGNLEFLSRIDHQVKVRGFRIELGEIETVLTQHPEVREAVVLVREEGAGDMRLVAYVVPKIEDRRLKIEDSNLGSSERLSSIFYPLSSELRGFLVDQLPEYMVPSTFVLLDALPLSPNGKVDRRALPAPDGTRSEQDGSYVAPRTPTEETLARVWAEVLGLEKVGIRDDFFGLGGHSLSATRAIVRVNQALNLSLSVRILFLQPTVEKLAATIDKAREVVASEDAVAQRIAELKKRIEQLNAQANLKGG